VDAGIVVSDINTGDYILDKSECKSLNKPCNSDSSLAPDSPSVHTSTDHLRGAAHAEKPERQTASRLGSALAHGSLSAGARRYEADAGDAADAACAGEAEEEIEITPEMIAAGVRELFAYSPESGSARNSAEDIYVAMELARVRGAASASSVVSSPKREVS